MVKVIDTNAPRNFKFVYDDADRCGRRSARSPKRSTARAKSSRTRPCAKKIEKFQEDGLRQLPMCIAKTQYSFSTDPKLRGAPSGHVFNVRDVGLTPAPGSWSCSRATS